MTTVLGPVLDKHGQAYRKRHRELPGGGWTTERRTWSTPAAGVRRRQPERIPIDYRHGGEPIGEVVHLERSRDGALWAVGMIADGAWPAGEQPLYWSPELDFRQDGFDTEIKSLAITPSPCETGLAPLLYLPGIKPVFRGCGERLRSSEVGAWRLALLERAASAHVHREGGPILVHDADEPGLDNLSEAERYRPRSEDIDAWMLQPLRYRPGRVIAVR